MESELPNLSLKTTASKIFSGVILITVSAIVLATYHYFHSPKTEFTAIYQECAQQTNYANCLSDKLSDTINKQPSTYAAFSDDLLRNAGRYKSIDLRVFSDPSHLAGMALADKNVSLKQATEICGTSFKYACLHGFVMEKSEHDFFGSEEDYVKKLENFCTPLTASVDYYTNCIHGIGHELWSVSGTDLSQTLSICNAWLSDLSLKNSCLSGVLMEYSKGDPTRGAHSHRTPGSRALNCNDVVKDFQSLCFSARASYLQYGQNSEPFESTYEFCDSISSKHTVSCSLSVTDRLLLSVGYDYKKARIKCSELANNPAHICAVGVELFLKTN